MSIVPLEFERRLAQRWAARFQKPVPPVQQERQPPNEGWQVVTSSKRKELSAKKWRQRMESPPAQ